MLKDKKGQIGLLLGAPIFVATALIIILLLVFGIGFFIHFNLLQLLGGAVMILTIIFGLGPAIANPTQTVFAILFTFFFIGGILVATPYVTDSLNFSVADISHSWENTTISCSTNQDCINGLKNLGVPVEEINKNLDNIKCEEVCYLKE